jgi:hypothetical protein
MLRKRFFAKALDDAGFCFRSSLSPRFDMRLQRCDLFALPTVLDVLDELLQASGSQALRSVFQQFQRGMF